MPTLTRKDAESLLRFVAEAESLGGHEPFTGELLVELGQLVQADWISYCELDRVRRRGRLQVDRIGDEYNVEELDEGLFWGGS